MLTPYTIVAEAHPAERSVTLLLNGKFGEESIRELDNRIHAARGAHQQIVVDLSEVTLVDRKAVEYFSTQAGRDVTFVNCPIYLQHWIPQLSEEKLSEEAENRK